MFLTGLPFSIVGFLPGAGVGLVILADVAVHDPSLAVGVVVVVVGVDKLTLRGRFLLFQLFIAPPVTAAVHQHHVEVEAWSQQMRTHRWNTFRPGHVDNDNNSIENSGRRPIVTVIVAHRAAAPINRSWCKSFWSAEKNLNCFFYISAGVEELHSPIWQDLGRIQISLSSEMKNVADDAATSDETLTIPLVSLTLNA